MAEIVAPTLLLTDVCLTLTDFNATTIAIFCSIITAPRILSPP